MSMSAFCAETPLPDYWKPVKTKLIEFSWSSPGTEFLKENIETIEAYAPYDGLGIHVVGKGEYQGKKIIARHNTVFSNVPWKYEWFADAVRDLKATKFRKLTDNFIRTSVSPGSVDWFSDSDWAAVCTARMVRAENTKVSMAPMNRPTSTVGLVRVKLRTSVVLVWTMST